MADAMPDKLWTVRELAVYLGYTTSTLATMISRNPERLPQRVAALGRPRWHPMVVKDWAAEQSRPVRHQGRARFTPRLTR